MFRPIEIQCSAKRDKFSKCRIKCGLIMALDLMKIIISLSNKFSTGGRGLREMIREN